MKIYLVGGAVRDRLLKLPVYERDYVVVGATPAEMLSLGFQKVGKDFPVFLHPVTKEEYALARTERKIAKGYTGFICATDPQITLEEDLKRRDLTINAIAEGENGELIDPFGGQRDLKKGIFRHVSPAFTEDPVRILRIARFAARFPTFTVAPTTLKLLKTMVQQGEIEALVAERVWQEWKKALTTTHAQRFFALLKKIGALKTLFPEIQPHYTVICRKLKLNAQPNFSCNLLIILNYLTPSEVTALLNRYKLPKIYTQLANQLHHLKKIRRTSLPIQYLTTLEHLDLYRNPKNLTFILETLSLLYSHRITTYKQINQAYLLTKSIKLEETERLNLSPLEIKSLLHRKRLHALQVQS